MKSIRWNRSVRGRPFAAAVAVAVCAAGTVTAIIAFRRVPPAALTASCWSSVPLPAPGDRLTSLGSIVAISSADIWAVGQYETYAPGYSPPPPETGPALPHGGAPPIAEHPLVLHWDGTRWSAVPTPNPGVIDHMGGTGFHGVAAVGRDDIWAVGFAARGDMSGVTQH